MGLRAPLPFFFVCGMCFEFGAPNHDGGVSSNESSRKKKRGRGASPFFFYSPVQSWTSALNELRFELDLHFLADEYAACLEDLVPSESEVFSIELSHEAETHALIAPRVFGWP